jgi:hypothetical protein
MSKLDTILAVHAELPSRHPVVILTEAITAARPSRGRNDTVKPGTIAAHPRGYGIVRSAHKEREDECDTGWLIVMEISPPATDDERDAIAMSMARKWDETLSAVAVGGPDDERMRGEHESRRAQYVRLRNVLCVAGLLS